MTHVSKDEWQPKAEERSWMLLSDNSDASFILRQRGWRHDALSNGRVSVATSSAVPSVLLSPRLSCVAGETHRNHRFHSDERDDFGGCCVVMGVIRATTAAAARVTRLECLKWTEGNLGTNLLLGLCHHLSPAIAHKLVHPQPRAFASPRFYLRQLLVVQRLDGSRRAHLPAVRDDRARPGLRLDAVPETERQAPQTSCSTSAALQVCVRVCACVRVCFCEWMAVIKLG